MNNEYVCKILHTMQNCKEPVIRVIKSKLTEEDINMIGELAVEFHKTIVFGSIHDVIFNKENNVHIVE